MTLDRIGFMSIQLAVAAAEGSIVFASYAFVGALALLAIGLAWGVGVFRRGSVVGPARMLPDEPWQVLVGVLGMTVLTWALAPSIYVALAGVEAQPAAPTSAPVDMTPTSAPIDTAPKSAPVDATPATKPVARFDTVTLVTLNAVAASAGILACVLTSIAWRRRGLTRLGFGWTSLARGVLIGAVGTLIVLPLMTTVGILTAGLWELLGVEHPNEHDLLRILGESKEPWLRERIILTAVVIAPLAEELLFRGHVQTLAAKALGAFGPGRTARPDVALSGVDMSTQPSVFRARWLPIVLTSLMFAAVHPWWTFPPIFFLSVCLGYVYERTGNLWACVILHAAFNASSVMIFLAQRGTI